MRIEYFHASKFGNGARVAKEFKAQMATKGVEVGVRHIRTIAPSDVQPADMYVFSSPGRIGKPIRGMRRFLSQLQLPAGARYAILTTEMAPKQMISTGLVPTDEEMLERGQRVRP